MTRPASYDLAVVGAGIVGLACALAAARRGKRVVVIDRDAQANGASVRNFGFVTVTGQARGEMWRRALRSRDIWDEVAAETGVQIPHRGMLLTARRPESVAVLEAFLLTEMGADCWTPVRSAAVIRTSPRRSCRRRSGARTSCGWSRGWRSRPWRCGWRRATG